MKRKLLFVSFILMLILVISCSKTKGKNKINIVSGKSISKEETTPNVEEKNFIYTPEELKALLPKIGNYNIISEKADKIRENDFSVNYYEINYSTDIIIDDDHTETQAFFIKIVDIGKSTNYPPYVAFNIATKFGSNVDNNLKYQHFDKIGNWKVSEKFDKIKKEAYFNGFYKQIFVIFNTNNLNLKDAKKIFENVILNNLNIN